MAAHTKCRVDLVLLTFCFICMLLTCKGQSCQLPGHDMANLTSSLWEFDGSAAECFSYNGTASSCLFTMSFCTPLKKSNICGDNASVCEHDNGAQVAEYRLAGATPNPFVELDNGQGFKTVFPLGGSYQYIDKANKTQNCTMNTTIIFKCNSQKVWLKGSAGKTQKVPVQPEIKFNLEKCLYNITFEFAGACVMIFPSNPTTHNLSAGSVLLIIFFVFVLAYLVFGAMWNIGCRGARGKEAIPNYEFWIMLPVYVADGFLFTFRCGQIESSSYESI